MSDYPVVLPWTCQRSGDCCRSVASVVMTPMERAEIERVWPAPLPWISRGDGFEELQAAPCPLLTADAKGRAICQVYDVRPYNCRRWGCFRPNPKVEPFEPEPFADPGEVIATYPEAATVGMLGAKNLTIRFARSRLVRRAVILMQRRAMHWARRHGWRDS